jgi:diguanylate cyclase (GGDEF)-like protein
MKVFVPSATLLSAGAFILLYRSIRSLEAVTRNAETFVKVLRGGKANPTTGADEAEKISYYVSDIISELRQRLADVDRYALELNTANQKLVNLAVNDALTELCNQGHVKYLLAMEVERAQRFNHPLSVLMIDVDSFKAFNDKFGHVMGDKALKAIAHAIKGSVRNIDVAARYGGEEFLVFLPETHHLDTLNVAERIRRTIAEIPFDTGVPDRTTHLTVSIGVSEQGGARLTHLDLIAKADACLYEAKRSGKNRVCS